MEVRARNGSNNNNNNNLTMEELLERKPKLSAAATAAAASASAAGHKGSSGLWSRLTRELWELGRAAVRLLTGQGSLLAYLLIPALIAMLWLLVCMLTTRSPSMSLEKRLNQKYLKEYFEAKVYEDGLMELHEERHEAIHIEEGQSVNVVIAMPFLDVNPLGATEYISTLEWILIYASVPVTFHIITNTDSAPFVDKIIDKVNQTTGGVEFGVEVLTLAHIMDKTTSEICPKFVVSEDFCDILMGKMTPLLFPYLFPELDHAIYVDRAIKFQDDIGALYQTVQKLRRSKEALALAPEQTNTYMRAFSGWQRLNPSTKLGRPPPDGKPGFNPDLIVMDLEKLRASATYRSYFSELKLNKLIKNYFYHSSEEVPTLGDMVNLMAAASESLFMPLGCEWNRNARASTDLLDRKYNVCSKSHHIRAWNGNPNLERMMGEKEGSMSVGRKRVEQYGDENELR